MLAFKNLGAKELGMKTFISLMMLSSFSYATVTSGINDCPSQFEGKVKEIVSEVGPSHAYSTQKIIFSKREDLKGESGDQVLVDILENGPFSIEKGKDYRVHLREGKLCWIEQI